LASPDRASGPNRSTLISAEALKKTHKKAGRYS
jgi:hypothetical protein